MTAHPPADRTRCMVCKNPNRARLIEAMWSDGMSGEGIAKEMTTNGWPITSQTILNHLKAHVTGASTRAPVELNKRDAAVWLRDRMMSEIERRDVAAAEAREKGEDAEADRLSLDVLDPKMQPVLGNLLRTQQVLDTRAKDKTPKTGLVLLMLGISPDGTGPGQLAPLHLTGGEDPNVIEGEAVEI